VSIDPLKFYNILADRGIDFFTGVPDSLLKPFCLCVDDNVVQDKHIIAANEGNAIAIATGYHLKTGKIPLVYMQNSGLGNIINPLLSLCDPVVYSIPMLLLIGWRGEPGIKDEPQHTKQGMVQSDLLKAMNIPFDIISSNELNVNKKIIKSILTAEKENKPYAIIIKKGAFKNNKSKSQIFDEKMMTREKALEIILNQLPKDSTIVSTTGKTSREIFEIREKNNQPHFRDFLTVGSMGHCSSIALGIAIADPNRKVFCIDGDGSLIMHMGSLSTIGKLKPLNFYHILINNYVHESVGGQKTSAEFIDIPNLVKCNNYGHVFSVEDGSQLNNNLRDFIDNNGPAFLEVKVKPGSRTNLGRPTIKPIDNKKALMKFLRE
jgi:phosphonopyruvate decarboxylase